MTHPRLPAPAVRQARTAAPAPRPSRRIAVIGAGRLGTALSRQLTRAGHHVAGPLPRDYTAEELEGAEVVLLCVPDREIANAAATWRRHRDRTALLGHCSGATSLDALSDPADSDDDRFSLHPLMTFTGAATPDWAGAAAAVSGASPVALATATALAQDLGLHPVPITDADRPAYHAAASIASNYLVTLECAAEALAATCGISRELLAPLIRQTVENWVADGADALTGPIARRDEATVARQREAVAERTPELTGLFDALTEATRAIAAAPADRPEQTRELAA